MEFTKKVSKKRMKLEERKKGKWVLLDSNDKVIVITTDKKIIKRIVSK
jgi:ribosomal silencing factor RsfS